MKRKYLEPALMGVMLLAIVVLAVFPYLRRSKGDAAVAANNITAAVERRYSTDMKELQDRFNQDKGKVRLLLLLSPT